MKGKGVPEAFLKTLPDFISDFLFLPVPRPGKPLGMNFAIAVPSSHQVSQFGGHRMWDTDFEAIFPSTAGSLVLFKEDIREQGCVWLFL